MSGLQSQRFVSTFALSHCAARLTCHLRVWVAMLVLGYWANIVNNTRSHLFPHCSQKKAVTYYYSLSSSNAFFLYLDGIPASRLRSLQNGGFLPCIIFITGRSSVIWSWNDSINEDTSLPMLGNLLITFQSGYLWQEFVEDATVILLSHCARPCLHGLSVSESRLDYYWLVWPQKYFHI